MSIIVYICSHTVQTHMKQQDINLQFFIKLQKQQQNQCLGLVSWLLKYGQQLIFYSLFPHKCIITILFNHLIYYKPRQPLVQSNILTSMNLIPFFFLLVVALTTQDALLTLARSHSCIGEVVSVFIRADNCTSLMDHQKKNLAIKMSQCLLSQMGKQFPSQCENYMSSCRLEGDAWNTFTTFYAHIDNLCHFYWQMMHHERAEQLISQLSQSSFKAEKVMRENVQQTHKILSMQHLMHQNMEESLRSQKQMAALINDSAVHINNITHQIETFIGQLHQDINQNYESLRGILAAINQGVSQVIELQGYFKAQITSINGMVFFVIQFLLILFLTSFQRHQQNRNRMLSILGVQITLELVFSQLICAFIGIRYFRCIFIILMVICQARATNKTGQIDVILASHLNTPRLERVFGKIIQDKRQLQKQNISLSCLALKIRQMFKEQKIEM